MRICVVGDLDDLTATYVGWLARGRGWDPVELPEAALGDRWTFAFDDTAPGDGRLEVGEERLRFPEIAGAFVRLNPDPALPPGLDLPAAERQLFVSERRASLAHFLDRLPGPVANRPSAGRSNGSKPYQMRWLAAHGLHVPRWLVTNLEPAVRSFVESCPRGAVYKACSGLRSRVRPAGEELLRRLGVGTTPVVVQEFIEGGEVRIHTVGERTFATEVLSQGVDYRFEHEGNEFEPSEAPPGLARRCCDIAREEGLLLAGFDFRVTGDRWYCLEMNPVPTFLPYEMSTGQPIGAAVLDLLASSEPPDRPDRRRTTRVSR